MSLVVEKIDQEDESVRKRLFDFLAPYEPYCLFLLGNLKRNQPDSHLYIVRDGTDWLGAAGYYDFFRSVMPFAFTPAATRALVRHIAGEHRDIKNLGGIASVAEPACQELRRTGYHISGDPRCVFMQLDNLPAPQLYEEFARPVTSRDHAEVAVLHRYLRHEPGDSPPTEEELRAVRVNPFCHVLAIGGEIVSTAMSNGIGISAFQVLGVATKLEHRNKGYARAVCASLIRSIWAAGARRSVLFTELDNLPAQACYQKLGYRIDGEYWIARLTKIV